MPKNRISKKITERALLTEVLPFETPVRFSNWGSFNYCIKNDILSSDQILKRIFDKKRFSIPFSFKIKKDLIGSRTLQLVHPSCSELIVNFYSNFDTMIARSCTKSNFSIRIPHSISSYFITDGTEGERSKYIEKMVETDAYAASYFNYKLFSHIHKFFDSPEFSSLEKKFSKMAHIDILKFFPSIYTHTISWAVRGKSETKKLLNRGRNDKSFTAEFDRLMQYMNYNETNGIPIGPELSRIFSEIIMQKIDCSIEKRMNDGDNKFVHSHDYQCCRYIDDFYLFYNIDVVKDKFVEISKDELEQYRLFINQDKFKISSRPFITDVSKKKIEVSSCINSLSVSIKNKRWKAEKNAIERLRVIASNTGSEYYALTNLFLSGIYNQCSDARKSISDNKILTNALIVYINVAFHWFCLDMRINGSFKIGKIIFSILDISNELDGPNRIHVLNKIYSELTNTIKLACDQGCVIEALNLAIFAKDLGPEYPLSLDLLNNLYKNSFKIFVEDETGESRLSYFSIVVLLFCCSDSPDLKPLFDKTLDSAKKLLDKFDPSCYAETAYLLIDLLKCPLIHDKEKINIVKIVLAHSASSLGKAKIVNSINLIKSQSWYFDWNPTNLTKSHLDKKKYLLSY